MHSACMHGAVVDASLSSAAVAGFDPNVWLHLMVRNSPSEQMLSIRTWEVRE